MAFDALDQAGQSLHSSASAFAEAVAIMARLRGPNGCPWDREQDFASIRKYTLEETYEVLDAIDRQDWPHLQEELGDLFLQVLFYSQMATEAGYFNLTDVLAGLNQKLIRRHPHVFGAAVSAAAGNEAAAGMKTEGIDSHQVLRNWEQIKQAEKSHRKESILDSVPKSFPALTEAAKLGSKAARSGFDWPDYEGVFAKFEEEIAELHEAISQVQYEEHATKLQKIINIEEEVGDLLFTAVNLARQLRVDPEQALRGTNQKFRRRFAAMEGSSELPLQELTSDQLEALWLEAKQAERIIPSEPAR